MKWPWTMVIERIVHVPERVEVERIVEKPKYVVSEYFNSEEALGYRKTIAELERQLVNERTARMEAEKYSELDALGTWE